MSKKARIDEDRVMGEMSELSQSLFFKRKPEQSDESQAADQPVSQPEDESGTSTEKRTPVRPSVRTLTRMPFEIYRDQHAALKQFSLEEQLRGEKTSMSQMVREAIDMWLSKRQGDQ